MSATTGLPATTLSACRVVLHTRPDRKGEHPQRHLAKFEGILQADAFAGFNKLYQSGAIQEAPSTHGSYKTQLL